MTETRRLSLFLLVLFWSTTLVRTIPSVADPSYTAIDLGTLQGGDNNSWAYGINNSSQITGYLGVDGLTIHGFF